MHSMQVYWAVRAIKNKMPYMGEKNPVSLWQCTSSHILDCRGKSVWIEVWNVPSFIIFTRSVSMKLLSVSQLDEVVTEKEIRFQWGFLMLRQFIFCRPLESVLYEKYSNVISGMNSDLLKKNVYRSGNPGVKQCYECVL